MVQHEQGNGRLAPQPSFDDVSDGKEGPFLHNLPASFELQLGEVDDRLRSAERHLLRVNPGFKAFVRPSGDKGT